MELDSSCTFACLSSTKMHLRRFEILYISVILGLQSMDCSEEAIGGVLFKRCSYKFRKIHRKTLVPSHLLDDCFRLLQKPL